MYKYEIMLERTEGTIKNGQFIDTTNIVHKIQNEENKKQKTLHRKLEILATWIPQKHQE
jgi:hypothetical protein